MNNLQARIREKTARKPESNDDAAFEILMRSRRREDERRARERRERMEEREG